MSGAAPANPYAQTWRLIHPMVVWFSKNPSVNPTKADEVDWLRPVEIQRALGGSKLDTCTLQIDVGKLQKWAEDIAIGKTIQGRVIVWLPDDEGRVVNDTDSEVGTLMFWGELSEQQISISPENGEAQALTARIEPRHFGELILGPMVLNPNSVAQTIHRDLVINPEIDRRVEGNMSSARSPGDEDENYRYHYFIDPESTRTGYAIVSNGGQSSDYWTIDEITNTLINIGNPTQALIKNPLPAAIEAAMPLGPQIRDFRLKRGEYLPLSLDHLLNPHGYGWYLKPSGKTDARYRIEFFRFGEGAQTEVFLQAHNKNFDPSDSTVMRLDIAYNIGDLANRVVIQGELLEREVTIPQVKAWTVANEVYPVDGVDTPYTPDQLGKGKERYPDSVYESDVTKRDVWRKWAGNEAGDYTGMRTEITTTLDLTGVLGTNTVPKRRKLHDCLAKDPDGHRRDVLVEWENPAPAGGGAAAWEAIPSHWAYQILEHEIGIYFCGPTPPAELMELGSNAKIRVTGCIRGDTRVTGTATRQATSPNVGDVTLYLDAHDTFADRRVQTTGPYASQLAGNSNGSYAKDDTTAIQEFAVATRNQEDSARLTANFTLHGLHPEYEIGQMITRIDGRNISLNRNAPDQATARYLQIVGITHNEPTQTTTLQVATLELKKRDLDTGVIA